MIHPTTTVLINGAPVASTRASVETGLPTIVGPVTIRWSRPATVLPPDPGECDLTIRRANAAQAMPVAVDDRIRILTTYGDRPAVIVFDGYVDDYTAPRPAEDGHQLITVKAIDVKGRQARRRIGAEPWPMENINRRMDRLEALLPGLTVPYLAESSDLARWSAPYLDIDSRDPIEVLQQHLSAYSYHVLASPDGIIVRRLGQAPIIILTHRQATGITEFAPPATVKLPARAITDTITQRWAYDGRIVALTASWTVTNESSAGNENSIHRNITRTWGDRDAAGITLRIETIHRKAVSEDAGPVTQKILDDMPLASLPVPSQIASLAASVVNPTGPIMPRMDPLPVSFDRLDPAHIPVIEQMTGMLTRWDNTLELDGGRVGIDALQTVIGGELILSGTPGGCTLTLTPEPLSIVGIDPLRWEEFVTPITWDSLEPDITWSSLTLASSTRSI